jgi:transposase
MGTLQSMPEGAAERLARLLKEARSKAEYQRVQCVWLRATLGLSSRQVAEVLGWQASSVRHVQARYLQQGEEALHDKPHGGRHHAHLTVEEAQNLMAPFIEKAKRGEVVVAAPVRQAYEDQLGYPVHHSIVYRALHRQGWRKVQPRPKHPKADATAQEEFKKSCPNWSARKSHGKPTRTARYG